MPLTHNISAISGTNAHQGTDIANSLPTLASQVKSVRHTSQAPSFFSRLMSAFKPKNRISVAKRKECSTAKSKTTSTAKIKSSSAAKSKNQCLSKQVLESSSGKKLAYAIGPKGAAELIEKLTETYAMAGVESIYALVDLELKNIESSQTHIRALASTNLNQGIYAHSLEESAFNPNGVENDVERATNWIVNASNSKDNDSENIATILKEYASNGKDLLDFDNLKELHARLVPGIERDYRGPSIAGGKLLSSISGENMLKQHIRSLKGSRCLIMI